MDAPGVHAVGFPFAMFHTVTRTSNQWTLHGNFCTSTPVTITFAWRSGTHSTVLCHMGNRGRRRVSSNVRRDLAQQAAETNCEFALAVSARLMPVIASPLLERAVRKPV
jgi:hypothetical protein